ncbi:hypothetical protein PAECIP111802_05529 [Paenibacillus allorhizosphaerae]|uniref:Uncharacterized protein n=1 Tax=Paenibacillus allorhizosphaerae TaxID=2849866 RepID=A0ABM8VQ01_9BACL|nr:hypothetical protein PAECIP111802_05529 [Paenibacillus allorhizosphaerae]
MERTVLIMTWIVSISALIAFVPLRRWREAAVVFLASQSVTWFVSISFVEWGVLWDRRERAFIARTFHREIYASNSISPLALVLYVHQPLCYAMAFTLVLHLVFSNKTIAHRRGLRRTIALVRKSAAPTQTSLFLMEKDC